MDEPNAIHSNTVLTAISADENRAITMHDLLELMAQPISCRIRTYIEESELLCFDRDAQVSWSLLYYFGIISFGQEGQTSLTLPSMAMRYLV
jgi:hypothetical protein